MSHAEFDAYAREYDAGMSHPLKRLAGASADAYMLPKVRWLMRDIDKNNRGTAAPKTPRLLEVGCGSGSFLKGLQRNGFEGPLRGCDISQAMLDEAAQTWGLGPVPTLDLITNRELPYENSSFDVIIACAVLHHVEIPDRPMLFTEIARVLAPGGRLYVFEHNPWNPLTQLVVRSSQIDTNAILLTAGECRMRICEAKMQVASTDYLLFFPPRWEAAHTWEQWLSWLPVGAQYVVSAKLPVLDAS